MEIRLAADLKIESEIPLLKIEEFFMWWKPNCHAQLQVLGWIDRTVLCKWDKVYESKVKLWYEREIETEILFHGYLKKVGRDRVADTEMICLNVESGSCKLDIREDSQSFQNTGKTYSEIEKQLVEENGGLVICTAGRETRLGRPVVRYEETVWDFSKRMASHVKSCIVSDVESGKIAFWFGLPKGKQIPNFSEEEYSVKIEHHAKSGTDIGYEVKGRKFYKIGDQTTFLGQEVIVSEVSGHYKNGELIFTYLLKRQVTNSSILYHNKFTGLGLKGKVLDAKRETVNVALDIDGGKSTGIYYYNWYPETGNSLYAMPEKGATVVLCFGNADEREGFIVQCLPNTGREQEHTIRCLELDNGSTINLSEEGLNFFRNGGHRISICDSTVVLETSKKLRITAVEKIRLKAQNISIKAADVINICQG